ncbi:MAG: radical SAM protein, partial [Clostridia bacterium]
MTVYLQTETPCFFADIADIIRLMLPDAVVATAMCEMGETPRITHTHRECSPYWEEQCSFQSDAQTLTQRWTVREVLGGLQEKRMRKRAVKQCCYYLLRRLTGEKKPWGSLTGIRPTRLYYEARAQGQPEEEIPGSLRHIFDLRSDKAALLQEIVRQQQALMDAQSGAVDLYVGIPFCTTRCAYCSFASGEIGDGKLVAPYLQALLAEIDAVHALTQARSLTPRALYIGGGTPTSLTAPQLDELLGRLHRLFPQKMEWTVEAGRPDTMDEARMCVLRAYPITRISVNPQTMNDATLVAIGRAHTAA